MPEVAVITTIDCPCGVACGDEPPLEQPAMNPAPATNTVINPNRRRGFHPLPPNRRRQTTTKDANGKSSADVIAAT